MKSKFKLNKEVKNKWVAALRSGRYKQGTEKLHNEDDNSFCCLGVARSIGLCKRTKSYACNNENVSQNFLPQDIQVHLVDFNDSKKWSFKKIANWIEKNL